MHVCSSEDRSQGPAEVDVVRSLPSSGRRRLRGCVWDSVPVGGWRRLPGELRWGCCPRLSGAWTAWVCMCALHVHTDMCTCAHGQACTYMYVHVTVCSYMCACVSTCACVCTRVSVHVYAGV